MCARDSDELEDEFEARVARQTKRIEKGRREKGRSFWSYVGLIGTIGWSVVVPMLLGVFLGLWLDRRFGTGLALDPRAARHRTGARMPQRLAVDN